MVNYIRSLTRTQVEEVIQPLLMPAIQMARTVYLKAAAANSDFMDMKVSILPVGGASKAPIVIRLLEKHFKKAEPDKFVCIVYYSVFIIVIIHFCSCFETGGHQKLS